MLRHVTFPSSLSVVHFYFFSLHYTDFGSVWGINKSNNHLQENPHTRLLDTKAKVSPSSKTQIEEKIFKSSN